MTVAGDLDLRHHRGRRRRGTARCAGARSSTRPAASAATPARRPASRRTRCRSAVTRTYVKYVDVGVFPQARRAFQVTRCNQCDDAAVRRPPARPRRCTAAPDGIVDFDKSVCIGCKACIAACPYDAIFINPEDHSAEKCNFCAHRLDVGLEPACVVVCPTEAILVGDLERPARRAVAQIVDREAVAVRRPEKETRPKLFYKGAHQATLDPLAARRPDGGLFMWSEQGARAAAGRLGPSRPAPTARRRRCSPTTCRTARRGTGGSASTRGPRASPRAPTWRRSLLMLAGPARLAAARCGCGPRRSLGAACSSPSPAGS